MKEVHIGIIHSISNAYRPSSNPVGFTDVQKRPFPNKNQTLTGWLSSPSNICVLSYPIHLMVFLLVDFYTSKRDTIMALTDLACKNAKPKEKPYKLADSQGLYLSIHPNGSKYWRMNYRFLGKQKSLSLGVYPEVPLGSAREQCQAARKLLAAGTDPSQAKKETKRLRQLNAANKDRFVKRIFIALLSLLVTVSISTVVFSYWVGHKLFSDNSCNGWHGGMTNEEKILFVLQDANQASSLTFEVMRTDGTIYRTIREQISYPSAKSILETQPDCCAIYESDSALSKYPDKKIPAVDEGTVVLRYAGKFKEKDGRIRKGIVVHHLNLNLCKN